MGAEALAEAASEAEASEAAVDLAVADTAAEALVAAREDRAARILVGASARLADGIAARTTTAAVAWAA